MSPFADPERKRAYQQRYYRNHREELQAYTLAYKRERYRKDPEYRAKIKAAAKKPPLVNRAHNAVWKAIQAGRLVRPDTCSRCQNQGAIEAAHHDYSKPLDVVWLCRRCHRQWDKDQPKARP